MLILFEHYASSQRYIEAEPRPEAVEPEAVVSNETSPTASFSLTRPRDVDDDRPPQSHPTYREGAHDLVEATDLRLAKGKAKIKQLLLLNTEHSAFVADGHGILTTKARNTRDTVLYPFMHCYATHYQSDADLFLEAFGQNWSFHQFNIQINLIHNSRKPPTILLMRLFKTAMHHHQLKMIHTRPLWHLFIVKKTRGFCTV
jgi:hypothetical protein